jgi:hypothetical protein
MTAYVLVPQQHSPISKVLAPQTGKGSNNVEVSFVRLIIDVTGMSPSGKSKLQ